MSAYPTVYRRIPGGSTGHTRGLFPRFSANLASSATDPIYVFCDILTLNLILTDVSPLINGRSYFCGEGQKFHRLLFVSLSMNRQGFFERVYAHNRMVFANGDQVRRLGRMVFEYEGLRKSGPSSQEGITPVVYDNFL